MENQIFPETWHEAFSEVFDVVIIGAGIAGCAALKIFSEAGLSVCVVEKSQGVGGRTSVRRGEGWRADLGAQFTNATTEIWRESFKHELDQTLPIEVFQMGKSDLRFVHTEGMSGFAKALVQKYGNKRKMIFGTKVTGIIFGQTESDFQSVDFSRPALSDLKGLYWQLIADTQQGLASRVCVRSRAVLLTAPLPQSVDLLKSANIRLAQASLHQLEEVKYSSCLAMILELPDSCPNIVPALWKEPSSNLSGIYDQKGKGIASERNTWVVHASASFSTLLWDLSDHEIMNRLESETREAVLKRFEFEATFQGRRLHKWKYSEPKAPLKESFHRVVFEEPEKNVLHNPFLLAGDAFARSSVEGAFCSGAAAGSCIVQLLQGK